MGFTYFDRQDDENKRDGNINSRHSHRLANHIALHFSGLEWTLAKSGKPIMKFLQSEPFENWIHEFFVKQSPNMGIGIPKQLVSLEEKYIKRCMEQIHINVLQGARCAISIGVSPLERGFVSDHTNYGKRDSFDVPDFAIDYPMPVRTGEVGLPWEDDGIVGSIMGSDSMISILSSPLFQSLGGKKLFENQRRYIPSADRGSPGQLTMVPSRGPTNATMDIRNSPSSESNAVFLTNKFPPSCYSQGMLKCAWENGIPHFAFSLNDQKELYVANAGGKEETGVNFAYSFHFKVNSKRSSEFSATDSDLVGKMQISSSFSPCSGDTKVMETKFVLFGTNDNQINTLYRNSKRSRKLSKVMEMLKAGSSLKRRPPSIYTGSNSIVENVSQDQEIYTPDLSETDFIPNLELVAIVVKDHVQYEEHDQKVAAAGGWGLNFLKKPRVKPTVESSDMSDCNQHDTGTCCSTSMDIIVPAGLHGGPRIRNGGPSSITERWKSGGRCDCGGWDIGCPLKVLKARPNSESQRGSKSFDMFAEGSREGTPTVKMVEIRDGLYFISFQSSLMSCLQCFAIAVAIIHSNSPRLRPKHAKDCMCVYNSREV